MSLKEIKTKLFERANGLCEYCKSPSGISSQPFVAEHIIPRVKGGETELKNLAFACQGCNNAKYTKTTGYDEVTNSEFDLYNPRKDNWLKHFKWSDDTHEVLGLTGTGRVTINTLKMNRYELKNLRDMLSKLGYHPPKETN